MEVFKFIQYSSKSKGYMAEISRFPTIALYGISVVSLQTVFQPKPPYMKDPEVTCSLSALSNYVCDILLMLQHACPSLRL